MIDNYNRLPIGKYLEIQGIVTDPSLEELDKQVKVISILADIDEEEVLHLPLGDYQSLSAKTAFLAKEDTNNHRVAKTYNLAEFKLKPLTDFRKIETCQFVDFQTFAAEPDKRLVELLSVFLVPDGKRYNDGYDVMDVQRAIRENMSVSDAVALSAFFLDLLMRSLTDSVNSCIRMVKRMKSPRKAEILEMFRRMRETLRENGVG